MATRRRKKIVAIGGGTGTSIIVRGLTPHPNVEPTAIVTTSDDGGSTGRLRSELGVLPYGDIRRCLVALAPPSALRDNLDERFPSGSLKGHAVGNLILASLEANNTKPQDAIATLTKALDIKKGLVIPVTDTPTTINASLSTGKKLSREHAIDMASRRATNATVRHLSLRPQAVKANPLALKAIREADLVVIGPGDLYTSVLPNLLVRGVAVALRRAAAPKVLVTNLTNIDRFLPHATTADYADIIANHLGQPVDVVLYNTSPLKTTQRDGRPVTHNADTVTTTTYIGRRLAATTPRTKQKGDALAKTRSNRQHDPEKLARALLGLIK